MRVHRWNTLPAPPHGQAKAREILRIVYHGSGRRNLIGVKLHNREKCFNDGR